MLHVAVILEGDDVRLIVARASREDLTHELALYAVENACFQLSSDDEARLRTLVSDGREREAIDLYFERGGRWASERLVVQSVHLPEEAPRHAGSTTVGDHSSVMD